MQPLPLLLLTSTNAWLHTTQSTHQSTRGNQRRRGSTARGGRRAARRGGILGSHAASHNGTATSSRNRAARQHLALRVPAGRGEVLRFRRDARKETNPDYLADDANRYREAGPLTLIEPGPSVRKAYGWLAEDDGPPKGEFTRITVSMKRWHAGSNGW